MKRYPIGVATPRHRGIDLLAIVAGAFAALPLGLIVATTAYLIP